MGKKQRKMMVILAATAAVYLLIRYAIPPLLPFLLGYLICAFLYPLAKKWTESRFYPKKLPGGVAFGVILLVFLILVGAASFFLLKTGFLQLQTLIANWNSYEEKIVGIFTDTCGRVDRAAGMEPGTTYYYCCEKMISLFQKKEGELAEKVFDLSVPTLVVAGEIFAFIGTAVLSAYFFMAEKERDKKETKKAFFLREETERLAGKLKEVFGAYLRAQGILMAITAGICTLGLAIMKNPYSLLIGIVIGLLDALPLIGTGLIMIPWILVAFLFGSIRDAVILIITYLCCYVSREFLEPKLIGKRAGISPLVTLISVYVGYQLFGILGVIWGPVAYVLVREITEMAEPE